MKSVVLPHVLLFVRFFLFLPTFKIQILSQSLFCVISVTQDGNDCDKNKLIKKKRRYTPYWYLLSSVFPENHQCISRKDVYEPLSVNYMLPCVCFFLQQCFLLLFQFIIVNISLHGRLFVCVSFFEASLNRHSSHESCYQHFSWWLLSEKRDKASIFLLFINWTEAASHSLLTRKGRETGETESIASVGCFPVVLLISWSWWLSLIYWHHLQSACCSAL